MRVVLINTNTIIQSNDPFTTGIPYMPIGLAYVAATLRSRGDSVSVVDAYGENPFRVWPFRGFLVQGLRAEEVLERVPLSAEAILIYAGTLTAHLATIELVRRVRAGRQSSAIVVMENTQAVTAYSLRHVAREFFDAGADYVLTGEGEIRAPTLLEVVSGARDPGEVDGLIYRMDGTEVANPKTAFVKDPDCLPFPAWDLFPLHNYWRLRYAHGPMSGWYLPLLTSRGCPYPCAFCVIPETTGRRWQARSSRNVVDEMEHHVARFGVREFHLEDVNPTTNERRLRALCEEIIRRRLDVTWKICAGTKIETIRQTTTLDLMAKAGCQYLSFSPESGSARVLKLMKKPFDHRHALALVKRMQNLGIRTQACFVLGFPGEEPSDLALTRAYVRELVGAGLDEIALFIMTPVPGSSMFGKVEGYENLSQLNFSPAWRQGYAQLNRFRLSLYAWFLLWKLRHNPVRLLKQPWNFLRRRFETKMEMTPYRALRITWWRLCGIVRQAGGKGPGRTRAA